MSITSALSVALNGLTASSRSAEVVSSNLANMLTEGYAPRDIVLGARPDTKGVRVLGITRYVDDRLLADRRMADAEASGSRIGVNFLHDIESVLGLPGDPASLSARSATFEASLISAASRPDENIRLSEAVTAASHLVRSLNAGSDRIGVLRTRADTDIHMTVQDMNRTLSQIADMNVQIVAASSSGRSIAGLEDRRQIAIDRVASEIPIVQSPRANGAVALYTAGGSVLLDGRAATLEFTPSNVVAPHMTGQNGLLSGLRINGMAIDHLGDRSPIAGGRLAALFAQRDVQGVSAQARLDGLARNLVERFQDPSLDPTLSAGMAGLFTDGGAAFDPADEIGLAGRLRINAAVDTAQGGAPWRLRDGIGAVSPGVAGSGDLLNALHTRLVARDGLASSDLAGLDRPFAGHVASLTSALSLDRSTADQAMTFAEARRAELVALEKEGGVDSDAEMQRLLVIEQAYAANARMIQTIDDLMQTLLRI